MFECVFSSVYHDILTSSFPFLSFPFLSLSLYSSFLLSLSLSVCLSVLICLAGAKHLAAAEARYWYSPLGPAADYQGGDRNLVPGKLTQGAHATIKFVYCVFLAILLLCCI